MTRLTVVSAGPITSVQDTGRVGAQRYGLPPSGAMDRMAMAIANALVGNAPALPVIEIGPLPAAFRIDGAPVQIAIAGAHREIKVDHRKIELNESVHVGDGETISVGFARGGIFSYIGLAGGIAGEPVFGSFSVTAGTGIGSPIPRALQAGDTIELNGSSGRPDYRIDVAAQPAGAIRVVAGPQADEFADELERFFASEWQVSPASNRMGYRLKGPSITHAKGHNIVSDGTVNGSIQIPGDGQPIVLMPDRGTTGGYPKIGTVITPDLAILAQMQAGTAFRFTEVSIDDAQSIARDYFRSIDTLPDRLLAPTSGASINTLLDANLAGVAISALDIRTWQSRSSPTSDESS